MDLEAVSKLESTGGSEVEWIEYLSCHVWRPFRHLKNPIRYLLLTLSVLCSDTHIRKETVHLPRKLSM